MGLGGLLVASFLILRLSHLRLLSPHHDQLGVQSRWNLFSKLMNARLMLVVTNHPLGAGFVCVLSLYGTKRIRLGRWCNGY